MSKMIMAFVDGGSKQADRDFKEACTTIAVAGMLAQ